MKKGILLFCLFFIFNSNAQKGKWVSLFDGKNIKGWHNYNQTGKVSGWHVMNGTLMTHGKSGNLTTDKEYENFILEFEFNVMPKGNSGIIYKVIERQDLNEPYLTGPEYQIIDDINFPEEIVDNQKTGANYALNKPSNLAATKPAGQWNKGKIVIKDDKIEHWLNGVKVVSYIYGKKEWAEAVAKTKFAEWEYAKPRAKGKICLQDHGDVVSYRKIRIKEL